MIQGILGRKLGMTQVFGEKGRAEPVTAIEAGPCSVTQVKSKAREGYEAVQLGFGESKHLTKAEKGHLKDLPAFAHVREFRVDTSADVKVGDKVDVSLFKEGDLVSIVGTSKSKGFAGVVKRHHFKGGPKTHGQTDRHRHPGAIGSTTTPGHLWKGLRMAGRMGGERTKIRRLKVVRTDPERNLLLVRGAVPGYKNGLLLIEKAEKRK